MVDKKHEICEGCQMLRECCSCSNPPKRTREVIFDEEEVADDE